MMTEQQKEWQRRLENAKRCAEDGKEGDVYFLQVSSIPVVSLFITTGAKVDKLGVKRDVHLRFVGEPDYYPEAITEYIEMDRIGYNIFRNKIQLHGIKKQIDKYGDLSMEDYHTFFVSTCKDIDSSIRDYHGVRSYRDGDKKNGANSNIFILHICDIFNLMGYKNIDVDAVPEVKVTTELLKELPRNTIVNDFEEVYLSCTNSEFLLLHLDFFYMIYCYYSNHSFMAIRLATKNRCSIFTQSSFFMNDDHFVNHQYGKIKEFNQNNSHLVSKVIYRTI